MSESIRFDWRYSVRLGLLAGVIAFGVSAIGMVEVFSERELISGVFTVGHLLLFAAPAGVGYLCARESESKRTVVLVSGLIAGLVSALPLIGLAFLVRAVDLREVGLVNMSPALGDLLTFNRGGVVGSLVLMALTGALGLVGAAVYVMPARIRRPLMSGVLWAFGVGLFSEIVITMLRRLFGRGAVKFIFTGESLKPGVALVLFLIAAGGTALWRAQGERFRGGLASMVPIPQQWLRLVGPALGILLTLILPLLLGTYLTEVADMVGIYVLMGLGLNIVVGYAGLLDLGYVAFYAIGAYAMAALTSQTELGYGLSFWTALPFAVLVAVLAGLVMGVPVLRMRGDYLAIVTLGFGEIIRILALSDFLKPLIGGAQGIQKIANIPVGRFGEIIFGSTELVKPEHIYYVILAGCLLALFVSWRLRDARVGRQWMALREDEDVAEAMGINLVKTKLLAFAIGAGFAGLAGAIFAPKLSAIFPHSFSLLVSINVLCLIIVGGMGSLPGVVVGALIMVGLPEMMREFTEYRLLMYGALLIVMMIVRPEGFWPSEVRKRELRAGSEEPSPVGGGNPVESG
jgi:branched-chain amino acid transport system permease protein